MADQERKQTKSTAVSENLRLDILAGVFAAEEKLTLDMLKERYGVGYSPLREALSRLASLGLVAIEEQCGYRVASLSLAELKDLYEVRSFIEAQALTLSMTHGDLHWEADVQQAWQAYQAYLNSKNRALDASQWDLLQKNFLYTLVKACHSPWLLKIREVLYDHAERYRVICLKKHYRDKAFIKSYVRDNDRLVKAVLTRDIPLALKLTQQGWDESIKIIAKNLKKTSSLK